MNVYIYRYVYMHELSMSALECMHMCLSDVYVGVAHVMWLIHRSEDNFVESILSFLAFVESRDRTPVTRPVL